MEDEVDEGGAGDRYVASAGPNGPDKESRGDTRRERREAGAGAESDRRGREESEESSSGRGVEGALEDGRVA